MNATTKATYAAVLLIAAEVIGATSSLPVWAAPAAATEIEIKDFMFSPMNVTVKAGSVVAWSNKDDEPHTVASDSGLFRSGALDTNERFTFKFDKPGTYHYVCSIHPKMVGTIVVQ
jgi:plastocyanin